MSGWDNIAKGRVRMSASKDKINRRELREAGEDKRQLAAAKKAAEDRKTRTKYIIVAAVVVLVFAFIFIYNSALPSRSLTAVTIDGEEYSVAELNYYYNNSFQTFYNNYYQYIQYGMFFNTQDSLSDQLYDAENGTTWRDYFIDQAVSSMKQIKALCDAGEAAGYVLDEDAQAEYDEAVASLETSWQTNGYQSLEQFISVNYGKGVTEELLKTELYRSVYASAYAQYVYDGYEYTDQEVADYYAEHADEFDYIDFGYYYAPIEEDGEDQTEAVNQLAETVKGSDEMAFDTEVKAVFGEDAAVSDYHQQGRDLSENFSEWLLDDARVAGDTEAVITDTAYYVVMFYGRDNNEYKARDFRHILISAEDTDGDDVVSQEEIQTAIDKAGEVYEEWKAGEATEDSFIELVGQYSMDSGSNTTGGLYTEALKGQMVPPVDEWLYAATEPGETGVVEYNEGGSYSGGHVLYYVGECEDTVAFELADSTMRSDAANAWLEELVEAMTATTSNLGVAAKNR